MFYFFIIAILIGCAGCDKEEVNVIENGIPLVSTISDLTVTDPFFRMRKNEDDSYLAASWTDCMHLSSEGELIKSFKLDGKWRYDKIRVFESKVFHFQSQTNYDEYDAEARIQTVVYSQEGSVLETHTWQTGGLLYDVEISNSGWFAALIYDPIGDLMALKRIDESGIVMASIVLYHGGTLPGNLEITDDNKIICTDSGNGYNLYFLDIDLNLLWSDAFSEYGFHEVACGSEGIYVAGTDYTSHKGFVALISEEGKVLNKQFIDSSPSNPQPYSISEFSVDHNQIMILRRLEVLSRIRITCLTLDLVEVRSLEIEGDGHISNMESNEIGGFSFLYGVPDTSDHSSDPGSYPRLFKLGSDCEMPE